MTDCKRLMEERRSVNFFDAAQPLTPELLRQIVELASLAPSAFNLQPWRLIAVRSPEGRIKFAESNAALLAMSVVYAARCFGVEGHFMSGIDFAGIKQEFALDEDEEVVMLLALGYAEGGKVLYPRRKRQSYDELVEEV